jgi:putative transcriptional regulator
MSDNPTQGLKMIRKKLGIKQADLAKKMDVSPSVISDYEKGRRPSPGVAFIKKYILMLYDLAQNNNNNLRSDIYDIKTPITTISVSEFEKKEASDNSVWGRVR